MSKSFFIVVDSPFQIEENSAARAAGLTADSQEEADARADPPMEDMLASAEAPAEGLGGVWAAGGSGCSMPAT